MLSFKQVNNNHPIIVHCFSRVSKRKISFRYQKPEPKNCCDSALKHFDDFYNHIFKRKWPSVRLGLLSQQKKIAVINNFGNVEETESFLSKRGAFCLKWFFESEKKHILEREVNSLENSSEKNQLADDLSSKLKEIEEFDSRQIYPSDKDVQFKAKFYEDEGTDQNKSEGLTYDPEEAHTSLQEDMAHAQFDKARLIMPNSMIDEPSLYEFVPATKLRGLTEFISESEYYKYYKTDTDYTVKVEKESDIEFPTNLRVYCFDRGETTEFPGPRKCLNDVYDYLLMDGADLLPVLSLDLKPGDRVLHMCQKSGAMAYSIFQTMCSKILVCDTNKVVTNIFKDYLYDFSPSWKNMLLLTSINIYSDAYQDLFNKILIDVPCTNDRLSLSEVTDNYFASLKLRQRLKLPENQSSILEAALKLVEPGGTVVYTTSTMSPVQNDGVVKNVLEGIQKKTNMMFCVKDLTPALEHTTLLFNFGKYLGLEYGTLVVPFLPSNFGPRYFCKIVKQK